MRVEEGEEVGEGWREGGGKEGGRRVEWRKGEKSEYKALFYYYTVLHCMYVLYIIVLHWVTSLQYYITLYYTVLHCVTLNASC